RDEREAVADARPVHRRDHGLEDLPPALERVRRRLLPKRARELAGGARTVAQVSTRAERAAGASHDRHPRLLLVAEAGERRVEVAPQLAVHGIERLGPVVGDGRDVTVELVEDRVSHATILP